MDERVRDALRGLIWDINVLIGALRLRMTKELLDVSRVRPAMQIAPRAKTRRTGSPSRAPSP